MRMGKLKKVKEELRVIDGYRVDGKRRKEADLTFLAGLEEGLKIAVRILENKVFRNDIK